MQKDTKTILLFDVDGTLTPARLQILPEMVETLKRARERFVIGFVGGSDFVKQKEQLEDSIGLFDYQFSENGLVARKEGKIFHEESIGDYLGQARLNKFINFTLRYIADLDIPVKTGTFIEYRTGLINVSPVGRNCNQKQRMEFHAYDSEHRVRDRLVEALEKEFHDYGIVYSIGGQISIDCYPLNWDKTYCLRFLEEFENVHFFGDSVHKGGNDFEIYESGRTIGHKVSTWEDTKRILEEQFLSN